MARDGARVAEGWSEMTTGDVAMTAMVVGDGVRVCGEEMRNRFNGWCGSRLRDGDGGKDGMG